MKKMNFQNLKRQKRKLVISKSTWKYINQEGALHEQDRQQLIRKFDDCLVLNEKYKSSYDFTLKAKFITTQETQRSGVERELQTHFIVFGKFDAFSERLKVLKRLFQTIDDFNRLGECRIEGIAAIKKYFIENVDIAPRQTDMLNPRQLSFVNDFNNFEIQRAQLDKKVIQCIDDAFSGRETTLDSFHLYEELMETMTREEGRQACEGWFNKSLSKFEEDISLVKSWYNSQNENPPSSKNMPPIASKAAWVRQLMIRLEKLMEIIQKKSETITSDRYRKIYTNYNKIIIPLVQYEKKIQTIFEESINNVKKEMLDAPIKIQNNVLVVNFSAEVLRVFQECSALKRFGWLIPPRIDGFLAKEPQLKAARIELGNLITRYDNIVFQITESFPDLFGSAKDDVSNVLKQVLKP
jgi:dynein heavy chain